MCPWLDEVDVFTWTVTDNAGIHDNTIVRKKSTVGKNNKLGETNMMILRLWRMLGLFVCVKLNNYFCSLHTI